MALSKRTDYILELVLTEKDLADEAAARLSVTTAPANAAEADAILALLDKDLEDKMETWFVTALADVDAGKELAKKLKGMRDVLKKFSALDSLPNGDPGIPAAQQALDDAKAAMGANKADDKFKLVMKLACADVDASDEIIKAYDAMIDAMQSL